MITAFMPRRFRRILFVTSNFPRWEGDTTTPFVLHLAQDLQELDWNVSVLAPHAEGAARRETMGGIQVDRFRYMWPESAQTVCYEGGALLNLRSNPGNFAKLPGLVAAELWSLMLELSRGSVDLVHSHWILPQGFTAGLASRITRVPHVATVHGGDVFSLRGPLYRPFKRVALRAAEAVTVNSSATRAAVQHIYPAVSNLHLIPMGAEIQDRGNAAGVGRAAELRAALRRGEGPLLVFVGRLIEEKGVADLIEAVAILVRRLQDVSAVIIGDGPDKTRFQLLADRLGVADRVQFDGWVVPEKVVDYLRAADIFVGPSKAAPDGWVEAQGIVFIEALLASLPVVATETGGVADIVRHEQTGLLVRESSPAEIAAAVTRLVEHPELARRLSEQGNNFVREEFSRKATARKFSALYEGVLSSQTK